MHVFPKPMYSMFILFFKASFMFLTVFIFSITCIAISKLFWIFNKGNLIKLVIL